jgi:hypothetical protein
MTISRTAELNPVAEYKEVLAGPKHNRKVFYNSKKIQIAQVDFYYADENDLLPERIEVRAPGANGKLSEFTQVYDYFLYVRGIYRESEDNNFVRRVVNFFRNLFGK